MSPEADDIGHILNETAARIFADYFSDDALRRISADQPPGDGWNAIVEAGFPLALVSDASGGAGLAYNQALGLLKAAGAHAAPLPLAETMLANWLLSLAGLAVAEGIACVAPACGDEAVRIAESDGRWHIEGRASAIGWARHAETIVVAGEHDGTLYIARLLADAVTISERSGINGHPCDDISVKATVGPQAVKPIGLTMQAVLAAGATMRVMLMAGAFERVLDMTVSYARERVQFGRPIARQQAIQQQLAVLAGAVATAGAAADLAARAFGTSKAVLAAAAAKSVASEAVSRAASIAHQVHGAIGFTQEYPLHFLTKCLWQWRDEFGSEARWSRELGRHVIAAGADNLWTEITGIGAARANL